MIKTCSPDFIIADLKLECDEAPESLIRRSLMRAVRQFAVTSMYKVWLDIPTQAGVQHYPFENYLPKGYGVQYVTEVMYNNCCIKCLDDDCKDWCASGYRLDDLTQISLQGYCPSTDPNDPECRDELKVKVVLRPKNDLCDLPCDLVERFDEELKDGALSYLLAMKGKSWTDFGAAQFYDNRFQGGIASAKCLTANKMNPEDVRIPGEILM
jgi:hypothetical protein